MLGHQLAQKGDAVHLRHFHIERDDVGDFLAQFSRRHEGIAGRAYDFDVRIRRQDGRQGLADAGGVINDQNANFAAHGSYSLEHSICHLTDRQVEASHGFRMTDEQITSG